MVHVSTFLAYTRKRLIFDDSLPKSQRKCEEGLPKPVEKIKKGDEEMYRAKLKSLLYYNRATESDRLKLKLMNILRELRPRYRVPYESNVQRVKDFYETEKEAKNMNTYQATSFTFKVLYILSLVIFGFFFQWLIFKTPFLVVCFIAHFLLGLFPIKNVIYLPRPLKCICDMCERIENFIWKKDITHEDIIEMKKLRNYGYLLIFLSKLSKFLNVVIVLIVVFVSITIDVNIHSGFPPETIAFFRQPDAADRFVMGALIMPIVLAKFLKFLCFQWIIEFHFYPEIMFLLY